jgi:hypothetical protein
MNKKILLGAAISLASIQVSALPFAPTDARGMAMGGTGVASAKTVHSVQYNPSLLSGGDASDDFGILLPQIGGYLSDEDEFIDSADEFQQADYVTPFDNALTIIGNALSSIETDRIDIKAATDAEDLSALNIATSSLSNNANTLTNGTLSLTTASSGLTIGLNSLSNKALRGGIGGGAAIAIPSKKFSVAISANNSTTFSGKLNVSQNDLNTINGYTNATDAYVNVISDFATATADFTSALDDAETAGGGVTQAQLDALEAASIALDSANTTLETFQFGTTGGTAGDNIFNNGELVDGADELTLNSTVDIIAVAISEVALSVSREFTIADRKVAIGLTPKLQRIDVYDYVVSVNDETDTDSIDDFGVEDTGFNLDIGASTKFGLQEQGTAGVMIKNLIGRDVVSANGVTVSVSPQIRAGVAYKAYEWIHLAADLDLTENEPVAFEEATQYASFGAEADVFGFLQLRTGFRTNLATSGQDIASLGFGLSPFSLFHVDIGAYANIDNPEKEAGLVFELGLDW